MRAATDNGEPRPPVSPSPAELGRTRPRRRGQARSSGGLALRSRPPARVADPSGPGSARGRTPPPPPRPEGERASVAPVPPNLVRGSAGVRQPLPAPLQSVGSGPAPAPARPAPGTTGTRAVRTCCVTSATLRISGVWMVWDGKTGDGAWDFGTASVCHSREVAVSLVIPYSVLSSSACTSLRATGGLRTVMARNGTSKSKRKPWSRRHFPARKEGGLQKKIKTHLSPCEELAGTR